MLQNKLFRNFSALTAVNFLNICFPLLTIPYLMKTLGTVKYGVLAYHQYLGQFALVILDFGFPLYAVSEVARKSNDLAGLRSLVASVYFVKGWIFLAVGLVLTFALMLPGDVLSHFLSLSPRLLVLFVLTAAFNSFVPNWLFQGLDIPQRGILPTLLARSTTLVGTFWLIRSPDDLTIAPLPYLFGAVVLLLCQMYQARQWVNFSARPSAAELNLVFRQSLQVFWSRLTIMGYVTVSPVLINLAAGPSGVAIYNICEKVIGVARVPFDMFASASFARFSRGYEAALARRFVRILGIGGVILAFVTGLAALVATKFVSMPGLENIPFYLTIYLLALIPISMHGFLGNCALLSNGKRVELAKSIVVGLLSYLASIAVLWGFVENKILVSILGMIAVEFGILLSRLFFSIKYRLL